MAKIPYTMVFVSDMQRSIAFYRDVLGLPLKFESPGWTEFATEGTTLALHKASIPAAAGADSTVNPAGSCRFGLHVPSLDALHEQLTAKGVRCIMPPTLQDFGARLSVYADPDGLPISFGESK
ncbi:MAG: VOC family protein [Acidobacteria bacterium]|nr:VOC family protein [Acidobacteriota bacterium]MBI3661884.1 VOC family protein [Acidobacteriota bacterium]